jgi:hypothetical protein
METEALREHVERAVACTIPDRAWAFATRRCDLHAIWERRDPLELGRLADEVFDALTMTTFADTVATMSIDGAIDASEYGAQTFYHHYDPNDLSAVTQVRGTPMDRPELPLTQTVALSRIVAEQAAEYAHRNDDDLLQFRRLYLSGDLLTWTEVSSWIEEQARAAGRYTLWVDDVAVPSEVAHDMNTGHSRFQRSYSFRPGRSGFRRNFSIHQSAIKALKEPLEIPYMQLWECQCIRFLMYWAEKSPVTPRFIPTTQGSPLEHLRSLSHALANQYRWSLAQAAVFVLTGRAPILVPICGHVRANGEIPALTRISMEIDPATSPQAVVLQYRYLRAQHFGPRKQMRDLEEKHLALALVSGMTSEHHPTWAEAMSTWNHTHESTHPDWLYMNPWNFSRDCLQAFRRLTGRDVSHVSPKAETDE